MEVSGQLHALAALTPGKEPLVPTGQEVGWATEPVWTRWFVIIMAMITLGQCTVKMTSNKISSASYSRRTSRVTFIFPYSESESVTLQLTVGQSVSQSVLARSPSGTHDQILAVVKTAAVLYVVGRPP
jgi:hypothetical protein